MTDSTALATFSAFALSSQLVLLVYFAELRVRPSLARRHGWMAYAFGLLGVVVGSALALSGESWQLFVGPLLYALWAAFGAWADLLARIEWRQPIRWAVFGPYVSLYLAAQMFLWWPMWNFWRIGWAIYLIVFVANTALNMAGHVGGRARPNRLGA